MAVSSRHPDYSIYKPYWDIVRDSFEGERVIKSKTFEYLPPTQGMRQDGLAEGQRGYQSYKDVYIERGRYPFYFNNSIKDAVSAMHQKPAEIELPPELEFLRQTATPEGESIQAVLRKMTEYQLIYGRCGLLMDAPPIPSLSTQPYLVIYDPASITNWGPDFIILREDIMEEVDFEWTTTEYYRVLRLRPTQNGDVYEQALVREGVLPGPEDYFSPTIRGRVWNELPFVFVNANDITSSPEIPPLMPFAELCLSIYKDEADYGLHRHLQSQDTLVLTEGETGTGQMSLFEQNAQELGDIATGAGKYIYGPHGFEADYIGVKAEGLDAQRSAIQDARKEAEALGGFLLSSDEEGDRASGEALRIRVATKRTSLQSVSLTAGLALYEMLKKAGRAIGISDDILNDPERLSVTPNTDFTSDHIDPQQLDFLMSAKQKGAPVTFADLANYLRRQNFTTKTDEELRQELTNDPFYGLELMRQQQNNQNNQGGENS